MPAKVMPSRCMCVRVQTLSLEKPQFSIKISQNMINWYAGYLKLKSFDEYYNQDRLFGFALPPYCAIIKIFLEGMFVT